MSDDLKARIAATMQNHALDIIDIQFLIDCLARIEELEAQFAISQQAVSDASHEYEVLYQNAEGLRAAKSGLFDSVQAKAARIEELERSVQERARDVIEAANIARTLDDKAENLKADLEAAETVWQRRPKLIMYTAWENEMAACFRVKEKR